MPPKEDNAVPGGRGPNRCFPHPNSTRPRTPMRGLIIMIERMSEAKRTLVLLAALLGLLLLPARVPAEPTAGKQDRLVVQMVCEFLHRGHLVKPEIGEEVSRRLFQRFLKDLDPSKLYL